MTSRAPEITDDQLLHEMPDTLRHNVEHMADAERHALFNILRAGRREGAEQQAKIKELNDRMHQMQEAASHARPQRVHVPHVAHEDHGHGHGHEGSWQPQMLRPVLPQSNREAFAEGAGIAAVGTGTALASQAVFPGVSNAPLFTTMGAGAALVPALPALGASLGYMLGKGYNRPMTGMALGGLTGAGGSMLALNALGATSAPAWPLLFPVAGTLAGYYLGGKLGHPMLGLATGTALSTYLTYAAIGGASLSLASPLVVGAGALGAAGLAAYFSANQIKDVITGEASGWNPFNWALSPVTGLTKGFVPGWHDRIRGLEHVFALPGKVALNSVEGIRKIFTHEEPEGFVQSVWTAPTRAISGLYKGFSGDHPHGTVEKITSAPGRFLKWWITPQGEGGGH